MKTFKFLEMVKKARLSYKFAMDNGMGSAWPVCQLCGRAVEATELKNEGSNSVEVWARCHGKEDFCKVEFPFSLDGSIEADGKLAWAVGRVFKDWMPFDLSHVEK